MGEGIPPEGRTPTGTGAKRSAGSSGSRIAPTPAIERDGDRSSPTDRLSPAERRNKKSAKELRPLHRSWSRWIGGCRLLVRCWINRAGAGSRRWRVLDTLSLGDVVSGWSVSVLVTLDRGDRRAAALARGTGRAAAIKESRSHRKSRHHDDCVHFSLHVTSRPGSEHPIPGTEGRAILKGWVRPRQPSTVSIMSIFRKRQFREPAVVHTVPWSCWSAEGCDGSCVTMPSGPACVDDLPRLGYRVILGGSNGYDAVVARGRQPEA
jgi:hypothetical protein